MDSKTHKVAREEEALSLWKRLLVLYAMRGVICGSFFGSDRMLLVSVFLEVRRGCKNVRTALINQADPGVARH